MSSPGKAVAVFLAGFLVSGCIRDTVTSNRETQPPASEAVSPIEPSAVPSDTQVVPPTDATSGPPEPTTPVPMSGFPLCSETASTEWVRLELAFVADWDGDSDVYTIHADGSNLSQFTNNPGRDTDPVWSKDGQQLAFVTDARIDPRSYISPADGSAGRVVAPDLEVTTAHVEWSPRGNLIAFRSMDDLYVVDTITGEETLLTRGADFDPGNPQFSPAGTMLAFRADVPAGNHRLFVVNVDGTALRELSTTLEDVGRPVWHPTQDRILFEGLISSEGIGLYVATLDGTIEKLPIVPRYGPAEATWSPDGSMIGYVVRLPVLGSTGEILEKNSLYVATADGNERLELVKPPDEPDAELSIHEIVWAPDSRHIAYTTTSEGRVELLLLDICHGTSSVVVEGIDFYSTPSWRPTP